MQESKARYVEYMYVYILYINAYAVHFQFIIILPSPWTQREMEQNCQQEALCLHMAIKPLTPKYETFID